MDVEMLDLDAKTKKRLTAAKLMSFDNILSKVPWEIERQSKLSTKETDEVVKSCSLAVLRHLPMTVFQLQQNCNEFRKMQNRRLNLGCSVLNSFTMGGLVFHGITEITGESGSGKTQICLQIAMNIPQKVEGGRFEAVMYLCTEDTFPIKRLHQMASKNRESSVKEILDRVFVEHVNDVDMLFDVLKIKVPVLVDQQNITLLIIDSVAALFRYEQDFVDARTKAKRLYALGNILHKLNREQEIAVLCVNQVMDVIDDSSVGFSRSLAPSLGLAWSNMVTTRLMLSRTKMNVESSVVQQQQQLVTNQCFNSSNCTVGPSSLLPKFRQNSCSAILIGVIVGIALSLVVFPLIDDQCLQRTVDEHFAGGRSLQSDPAAAAAAAAVNLRNPMAKSESQESVVDDYEPLVNLNGPPKNKEKKEEAKVPFRARFYSTELGIRDKLFVAVISEEGSELGQSINETLVHQVDRLMVFVRQTSNNVKDRTKETPSIIPILTKVSRNNFPIEVLRYIGVHFLKDYDFFFVISDSAYVRGRKLVELVGHISAREDVYMGQRSVENLSYCNFESGILFSNSVLRAVHANVANCIADDRTIDDSRGETERIGKCVHSSIDVTCMKSVQGREFKTYKFKDGFDFGTELGFIGMRPEVEGSLTFRSISLQEHHYKLHLFFSVIELQQTHDAISSLQLDISEIDEYLEEDMKVASWPLGTQRPFKTKDRFSVLRWDYLTETSIYPDDDYHVVRNLTSSEKRDLSEVVNASVSHVLEKERDLTFVRFSNAYRRFDPLRGLEYVLDLVFGDLRSVGSIVSRRTEVVKPLGKVELIPIPYVTENTRLVMVLPVSIVDQDAAKVFLQDFTRVCLEKQDNSMLILVFLYDHTDDRGGDDIHGSVKGDVETLNGKYHSEGAKLSWISMRTVDGVQSEFGMLDLVSKKYPPNALFLVCQPGMEIHQEYLNRARMNTIAGWQVFFPIPFAQYHGDVTFRSEPRPSTIEIHKRHGQFSSHSFDHYSFYNSDYLMGRKLVNNIPVAHSERDLRDKRHRAKSGYDVYAMFLNMKSLHVMRAVEPSLRIQFQMKICESSLGSDTYQQCLIRWSEGLASRSQLASLIFDYNSQQQEQEKKLDSVGRR